jgi:hypothetical protein
MDQEQSKFEGWAKIEIMGHQSHTGLVSTHVFGDAVLLRVDSPAIPEREETLGRSRWTDTGHYPAGAVVKHPAVPATSVLLGAKSIYRIQPCTEEVAINTIIAEQHRPLSLVSLPVVGALPAATEDDEDTDIGADLEREEINRDHVPF